MKKTLIAALSILSSTTLFAAQPNIHTWHDVTSTNGQWNASLQIINEPDHAWFVGADGQTKINGFKLDTIAPQKFGFAFDGGADFDVAYSLTLVEQKAISSPRFTSKTCVFVVTAKGPAKPDVTALAYNGATCQWKINEGVGEDFSVG